MIPDSKPLPTEAVMDWLRDHGVNPKTAAWGLGQYENVHNPLDYLGDAVSFIEYLAHHLTEGTIGRRDAVEGLRNLHQVITTVRRDLDPRAPSQVEERKKWNEVGGKLAPWQPLTDQCENLVYGKQQGAA